MGYFIENKEIAKESKSPAIISLSGSPNYIQFESKETETDEAYVKFNFNVVQYSIATPSQALVQFEELAPGREGIIHSLQGTYDEKEVSDTTFFIHEDRFITAQNLRACMLKNNFIKNNFRVTVPFKNESGKLSLGAKVVMEAIAPGPAATFRPHINSALFALYSDLGNPSKVSINDTISKGISDVEIQLDIYRDTGVLLGDSYRGYDAPQTNGSLGTYTTTLTKAYFGKPIWFDLNALMGSNKVFSDEIIHNPVGWKDAGTMTNFRFVASKSDGVNTEPFYISNVLHTITGYQRELEINDLYRYGYVDYVVAYLKPLTNCTELTHIKGQTQYFNFIFANYNSNQDLGSNEYSFSLMYKLYTHSRILKKTVVAHEQKQKLFHPVNTIRLDIDRIIESEDDIAYVEVVLCQADEELSSPMKFTILPECLYSVHDFAFLNALGGWSSFNFGGSSSSNFKTKANTFYKTQTPDYKINSQIESVYSKAVEEQQVVQTMPINATMCEWLKELSSSVAVYELSTKRYVIVDELTIKPSSEDELFILDLKYHYSDTYNGVVK